jgi:D-3-phosphoglycerate dehydrogenase/(S)-sulfolactate dehydrogenase
MATFRTLITVPYMRPDDAGDRILRKAGVETVFNLMHGHRSEEEMIGLLKDIDAAIVGLDPFTARVMDARPRLKVISRSGVGYDDIDVPAATERGVAVCTTPGLNHNAVAEYTFALMLQCARKLYENLQEGRSGGWAWHQGRDLAGRTLGIVGLGAIGKQVAKRARAFEMQVLAYDVASDEQFALQHGVQYVSLEALLREGDYVSVHLFLDAKSRHIISAERLALMKPTAYLINTSRGGVIDSMALHDALKAKRIAGAALDVYEKEPLEADSPLRKLDNLYISPHCSGASDDPRNAQIVMAAENVLRVLRREPPLYILNPEALKRARP